MSVLSQSAQFELFKHFGFQSGRDMNKFEKFEKCARGENGIYYITEGTNAYIMIFHFRCNRGSRMPECDDIGIGL